jgi:hypothetical protein
MEYGGTLTSEAHGPRELVDIARRASRSPHVRFTYLATGGPTMPA